MSIPTHAEVQALFDNSTLPVACQDLDPIGGQMVCVLITKLPDDYYTYHAILGGTEVGENVMASDQGDFMDSSECATAVIADLVAATS